MLWRSEELGEVSWLFDRNSWINLLPSTLTRLTLLIHTSVLPSNWNLRLGPLGQVHMVKWMFEIFLHARRWSFSLVKLWFSSKLVRKMNYKKMASAWRNFKNIFFTICTWPNGPDRAKFLPIFQFEGKTDVWISQVRRVNSFFKVL